MKRLPDHFQTWKKEQAGRPRSAVAASAAAQIINETAAAKDAAWTFYDRAFAEVDSFDALEARMITAALCQ